MPPLGGNTCETTAPDSPTTSLISPMCETKKKWKKCLVGDRHAFMKNPSWKTKFEVCIQELHNKTCCVDLHNRKRSCKCTRMSDIEFTEEMKGAVAHELFKFALLDFESSHLLVLSWMRCADLLQNLIHKQEDQKKSHVLPGTPNTMVCQNAIASLIGCGKTAWTRPLDNTKKGTQLEHGATGKMSNNVNAQSQQLMESFFQEIATLALPRATRVVREHVVGDNDNGSDADANQDTATDRLRDDDVYVIDLPPSFTKRSMHKRFVMDHCGYAITWNSNGKISSKLPMANKQQIESMPSWWSFLQCWKRNHPKMRMQKPREDTCGHCHVFANSFRFQKRKKEADDESESGDESKTNDGEDGGDANEVIDTAKCNNEELILKAAKHVKMAKTQRDTHNEKEQLAKENPKEARTCAIDCALNTYMPCLGDEQPGETCCHSPVNVCTLDIVNTGLTPMRLCAHVCCEDEGTKGWNNVASCIRRQLFHEGILGPDKKNIKEMNFVFDNCGGQNKNRMVLRMLLCMAQRRACDVANAIFLAKGHTKNDCDRMFNLMKAEHRKKNSHVPTDVEERLGAHKDVTLLRARPNHFHDWDVFENKHMTAPKGAKSMHVFSAHADDSDHL